MNSCPFDIERLSEFTQWLNGQILSSLTDFFNSSNYQYLQNRLVVKVLMSLSSGNRQMKDSQITEFNDSRVYFTTTLIFTSTYSPSSSVSAISFVCTLRRNQIRYLRRSHFSIVLLRWITWDPRQEVRGAGSHDRDLWLLIFRKSFNYSSNTSSLWHLQYDIGSLSYCR